jgi:phosphoribosylaminoimidazolecarboxamide formyltransferase/IMP cyclohydrolase
MIRAAAKNHADVAVVVESADYATVLGEMAQHAGMTFLELRQKLAAKAYARTAAYDAAISNWFAETLKDNAPEYRAFGGKLIQALRYGENPHQSAAFYRAPGKRFGVATARQLQGKELSYNNFVDLEAARSLAAEFKRPAAVIIKHNNPCGAAEQENLLDAYLKAYASDPVSAFGGVLAFNRVVDSATAEQVAKLFVECIAAPGFDEQARAIFGAKKNLRLLELPGNGLEPDRELPLKRILGGVLVQQADLGELSDGELRTVTKRVPTAEEMSTLRFAWKVSKHVKSNAIVFAKNGATRGVGAGQMSRVDSVKLAVMKAQSSLAGSVVASDAFFPFPDGVEEAAKAGATAVIQPGGSVKDPDVIAAADRLGMAMVFTGMRHFLH